MIILDVWVSGDHVELVKPGEEQIGTTKEDGPEWTRHRVEVDADVSDPEDVKLNMPRHAIYQNDILK